MYKINNVEYTNATDALDAITKADKVTQFSIETHKSKVTLSLWDRVKAWFFGPRLVIDKNMVKNALGTMQRTNAENLTFEFDGAMGIKGLSIKVTFTKDL